MTILVDSSVWIDHLRGDLTAPVNRFRALLVAGEDDIITADLIVLEVVRGCRTPRAAARVAEAMQAFDCVTLGGLPAALAAASCYRRLRDRGVTVAKTVDLLIARWCIGEGVALLHDDRDFADFEAEGLRFA